MVKSLKLAFAILAIGAASAQAEGRAQFYIPDKPAKLVYLFTCKGETVEEVNENWAKAQAVFAQNHQKLAAELETETRVQRETGKAPSQEAIDAHNKRFAAHKSAVAEDLAPLGCRMDGLVHMP
ncbi:hypothetical protein BMG00_03455 [Thioclava marina]|uniref:Uncharacterized protein n=1 Tax=Thioclava marina TaxID=1915077 RepID=A0ABX3MS63_9RHOB|nr:hypothetical protein [Thioclava marina]OOY12888.1 hypothetical protein BMG00_03455 [Thioclava marina]